MATRIVFGGVIGAGKSTLACSVYAVLKQQWSYDVGLLELDIWSDTHPCILGEKPWSERRNHQSSDPETYRRFERNIDAFSTADSHELMLGDLPGWDSNPVFPRIRGFADGAVLVTRERTEVDRHGKFTSDPQRWERWFERWDIPVVARVQSLRDGQRLKGGHVGVTGLDRELKIIDPAVWHVARLIADHAT